jgi:iron-sulfur cluster insertion protein
MTQTAYLPSINRDEMRLTSSAQQQMARLMADADSENAAIRVFVSGGGCGGMTYGMTYAERETPYDKVYEGAGYRVLVDIVALNYLRGCEIDFVQDGLNKSFVFNNVFQAVGGSGACGGCGGSGGCGSSGF